MNNTILKTKSGMTWFTETNIENLMKIGVEMQNALTVKIFAEKYSLDMDLYFLKNKNGNVILNVSFFKETGLLDKLFAKSNCFPSIDYKEDIEELFLSINKENELEKVIYN